MTVITRHAARGLIMTPAEKVLLLKIDLPWVPGGAWTVPGGGIEKGETAQQCVTREIHEETGLHGAIVSRELWRCDFRFHFRQKERRIVERYFLVQAEQFEPTTENMIDYELEWMMGFKWWSAEAILSSRDSFSPKQMGDLVQLLAVDKFPDETIFVHDPLPESYCPA